MKKTYTILMALSLIYGGFLLAAYCFMSYSIIWRGEVFGVPVFEGGPNMPMRLGGEEQVILNNKSMEEVVILKNESYTPQRELPRQRRIDTLRILASPFLISLLLGGLISIANGLAIRSLTHEKEVKQLKENLKKLYLTQEEKSVLDELENAKGESTQRELTERTGYSRVKTHRVLQKLESKNIIQKIPYGQTNKILLTKETKQKT
jgi:uncharacterized membrane protein